VQQGYVLVKTDAPIAPTTLRLHVLGPGEPGYYQGRDQVVGKLRRMWNRPAPVPNEVQRDARVVVAEMLADLQKAAKSVRPGGQVPSTLPDVPFQVSLFTTDCERLAILDHYANDAAVQPLIRSIAESLCAQGKVLARRAGVTNVQPYVEAEILRWVQSLPYDPKRTAQGEEWFQPPLYTLTHGGNCEDLNMMLVGMSRGVGIPARLIWINQTNAPLNHVTSQAWLAGRWVWTEASIRGAMVAENPYHAAGRLGQQHVVGMA
jgi:transglutaminase-like putative cysteine protease